MKLLNQVLRGVVIGVANIIPGVSGGTMMVSMGIYDTLIHCITHLFSEFWKSVKTLLPYAVGMLIGIFALASLLTYCFTHFPLPTGTAFIGLILGGLNPVIRKIDRRKLNWLAVLTLVTLFGLMIVMALASPADTQGRVTASAGQMAVLLGMGAVASATMLIPGVSGSMVLMLLGYYRPVLAAVNDCKDGLLTGNFALVGQQLLILVPFGIGVLLGIYLVAKAIDWLMRRFPTHTYCGVLGLVLASPIAILLRTDMAGVTVVTVLVSIATFAGGFVVSAMLSRGGAQGAEPADAAGTAGAVPTAETPDA